MLNPMQDLLPLAKIHLKNAFCFKPVWFFETAFVALNGLEVLQQFFLCRIIKWLSKTHLKWKFVIQFQGGTVDYILIYVINRNTNNQYNSSQTVVFRVYLWYYIKYTDSCQKANMQMFRSIDREIYGTQWHRGIVFL